MASLSLGFFLYKLWLMIIVYGFVEEVKFLDLSGPSSMPGTQ